MSDEQQLGPDRVLQADGLTTSSPDGKVKLRDEDPKGLNEVPPVSVPTLLRESAKRSPEAIALGVKRDDKWITWTYKKYYEESRTVAKAFIALGLEAFHSVGILGFNAPEWFIAQNGAIFSGAFSAGIYTTNSAEACKYVAENCRANIIVVEDAKQLDKIKAIRHELPHLKAIVQYTGEVKDADVLSWKDLLAKGEAETDDELEERLKAIAINQCCALIYTSGTTGPPKVSTLQRQTGFRVQLYSISLHKWLTRASRSLYAHFDMYGT